MLVQIPIREHYSLDLLVEEILLIQFILLLLQPCLLEFPLLSVMERFFLALNDTHEQLLLGLAVVAGAVILLILATLLGDLRILDAGLGLTVRRLLLALRNRLLSPQPITRVEDAFLILQKQQNSFLIVLI